ncbi:glycosyltransferase family 2 protein [Rhodococcoides yunnanense]|uniref:Glycosyltransferase family 2 protein n=1 Tax=Rhodococcoides yunnanense TaxID=278209 RepID=A0ABU4B7X1_9NOCA|nr:glycosyltransferase family 2 protein [Rhodococcus yunnanensis]MDV6260277.1 glycosyltransferase family 2 protein [Rhodococcus yunnanensis]
MTIAAGIVTFNPDVARLEENLDAIVDQVDIVRVIDNNSSNIDEIRRLTERYRNVVVIERLENHGIAAALNIIVENAAADEAQWVLLLDQDSVCSTNMIDVLMSRTGDRVGIVCSNILDPNVRSGSDPKGPTVYEVDACITSGSLCNVTAWSVVEGYDEQMFVDYVDFEFCLRLRMAGYTIVRDTAASIQHEFGAGRVHWRFTTYNYSSRRLYTMARDIVYYAIKHRRSPKSLKAYGHGLFGHLLALAERAATITLFEREKGRKVAALLSGVFDALTHRPARRSR